MDIHVYLNFISYPSPSPSQVEWYSRIYIYIYNIYITHMYIYIYTCVSLSLSLYAHVFVYGCYNPMPVLVSCLWILDFQFAYSPHIFLRLATNFRRSSAAICSTRPTPSTKISASWGSLRREVGPLKNRWSDQWRPEIGNKSMKSSEPICM